ncbi:type VII toxin-antitoxin system HepT family RNase toxin [Nitrospira sp. Kam-Ns4a]
MTRADPAVLRRKLTMIVENLQALEPITGLSVERYRADLFRRKGTERLLQELIEAAIDLNTHVIVQEGHSPLDDYDQGFIRLAEMNILPHNLATALAPSAGLRNRLVHEYDAIVDALVLDAVRKAEDLFPRYVAAIEAYLHGKTL